MGTMESRVWGSFGSRTSGKTETQPFGSHSDHGAFGCAVLVCFGVRAAGRAGSIPGEELQFVLVFYCARARGGCGARPPMFPPLRESSFRVISESRWPSGFSRKTAPTLGDQRRSITG